MSLRSQEKLRLTQVANEESELKCEDNYLHTLAFPAEQPISYAGHFLPIDRNANLKSRNTNRVGRTYPDSIRTDNFGLIGDL
jgi:hypothetical protein